MSFLHPAIAWAGVAAVALPIIIHFLFRRRRVPVEWAAMDLLREAVRRTNRRMKVEQWIVLALRCLAVLAAGLAIAVPVLDGAGISGETRRLVIIVVDDGPTSGLKTGAESELARAIGEVRTMLGERTVRDRVGVVLASKPPRIALAPTTDAAAVEQSLARIEPAETPSELKDALALAVSTIDGERAAGRANGEVPRIVVASAFRRATLADGASLAVARVEQPGVPRIEVLPLVPARDAAADVRVDSVEARPAPIGDAVLVRAKLVREGPSLEAGQTFVRVASAGVPAPPARAVMWEKGETDATVEFQLIPTGLAAGTRRIGVTVSLDDDALAAGNTGHASVDLKRELEIGVIGRRTSLDGSDIERVPSSLWVARALSPAVGSGMRVREIDPSSVDDRALLGLDAAVIARPDLVSPAACESLGKFALGGGVVVVLPSGESLAQPWGQSVFAKLGVSMRVAAEAVEHAPALRLAEEQPSTLVLAAIRPEMAQLVAPIESTRTVALSGYTQGEVVLANADGSAFAVAQSPRRDDGGVERGMVIAFCAAPELSWTNLPVKPLMVPLFQEVVRAGIQIAAGRSEVVVGEQLRGDPQSSFRNERGLALAIGADGTSGGIVEQSGLWRSDTGTIVAANLRPSSLLLAPNASETVRTALGPIGDVRFRSADEGEVSDASSAASNWSFALLLATLAILLLEGVLSRIFSHASLRRASTSESSIATVGRVRAREQRQRPEPAGFGGRA